MAGGLGKGLDSLIPNIYDENFDSNGSQSLEDILNEDENSKNEIESIIDDITNNDDENNDEKSIVENESDINTEDKNTDTGKEDETNEKLTEKTNTESVKVQENDSKDENSPQVLSNTQEVKKNENVAEVLDIVDKNPRITLWSSRSAAVFRYLRKTEPEFSISREASILIDEAVSKKYPHIWELFEGV